MKSPLSLHRNRCFCPYHLLQLSQMTISNIFHLAVFWTAVIIKKVQEIRAHSFQLGQSKIDQSAHHNPLIPPGTPLCITCVVDPNMPSCCHIAQEHPKTVANMKASIWHSFLHHATVCHCCNEVGEERNFCLELHHPSNNYFFVQTTYWHTLAITSGCFWQTTINS